MEIKIRNLGQLQEDAELMRINVIERNIMRAFFNGDIVAEIDSILMSKFIKNHLTENGFYWVEGDGKFYIHLDKIAVDLDHGTPMVDFRRE